MENTGVNRCPLHSLERDHTHLWSNIESKVQNELKTHGFFSKHWSCSTCLGTNRSNPISYSFYLFEVETLRNIQTAKQCLVWISFVFAQNGKHWSAQPALQCCPLHSLERDHTHLWSNIESKVQILAQKCTILVNFPEFFERPYPIASI